MTRTTAGRLVLTGFLTSACLHTAACSKHPPPSPPSVDAAPAPAPTPSITELAPLDEDDGGGVDAAIEAAAPKKYAGRPVNQNQLRIQACCNAMRSQAKQLGPSSPEGFQINAAAAQCDVLATQLGPAGTAPELAQFRQILKSIKLPAACNF